MIIRFIIKNLFSFKEETEFNLFPNKTLRLPHHKTNLNGIEVLRLSAIYGANGSGKSNLIKSIKFLKSIISKGSIDSLAENKKFKLSSSCKDLPIELGIEFYCNPHNYYYSISINNNEIVHEYFAESKKENDELIFERKIENGIQKIFFFNEYYKDDKNKLFASVLEEKILGKDQLLFSFLSDKYENEFMDIKNASDWFSDNLIIISPETSPAGLAHIIDTEGEIQNFTNNIIDTFNTGIVKIGVEKRDADEYFESKTMKTIIAKLKSEKTTMGSVTHSTTGEELVLVNEGDKIIAKRIYTEHTDENGNLIEFSLPEESDGTRRILDYIPALLSLISTDKVFLIDEIERSIHPLMIKKIISKFSLDEQAKGQLIFTTHESSLLDQNIVRTDEIWFAQKDFNGATKLYSLSDYKVHNTIDIENGYLNGRYGGIPFLSNLQDLNWHTYADVN